jgi:single-stranded DNA-binding protein
VDGYLAAKPTSRTLPSGTAVANAHLAESALYTIATGRQDQLPNWFPLSFYDAMARKAIDCDKGDHLMVKGRIEQREFTPEGQGQRKRLVWEVIVDEFHVIARKSAEPTALAATACVATPSDGDDWPVGLEQ